jgi:hypothetical protein
MDPIALAQAGPVAILLVGIFLLARAFIKGDVVPGHIYQAERAQRIEAEKQAERNAEALAALAKITANGKPGAGSSSRGGRSG